MNQMTRTLAFVIAASASVIGAVVTHVATRPPEVAGYQDIGQVFYPDFTDPTKATAVRVAAWNPRTSRVEEFEVRQEGGQWRIPSHNNYPADAQDQLARAAASAVGIVRGSLVSESKETFERLGVVDPLDQNALQGAGQTGTRVTLFQGDDVLADFIIGKRPGDVDDAAPEDGAADDASGRQEKAGRFYVRRPEEDRVYLADVKIDVSTRFRDWIKKDLLELSQFDLRRIIVDQYSVEVRGQELVQIPGDLSELTRESSSDPWKLKGLDETKEKLKTGVVSAMARALDDLQIVGIRKKPPALVRFFRDGVLTDQLQVIQVIQDLQRNGFYFDGRHFYSSQGEVHAGTKDGVLYALRFGEVFTGSDLEVEVGQSEASASREATPAAESSEPPGSTPGDASATRENAGNNDEAAANDAASRETDAAGDDTEGTGKSDSIGEKEKAGKRSRYVIVEATFDPALLGPEPVPPVKPTPPEGVQPAPTPPAVDGAAQTPPAADPAAGKGTDAAPAAAPATDAPPTSPPGNAPPATQPDDASCDDAPPTAEQTPPAAETDAPAAEKQAPSTPSAADAPASTPAAADDAAAAAAADADPAARQKTPQELYDEALKEYERELEAYQAKREDYDRRVKAGKQRVDELNKRFAEWYYVISADLFEDLRVSRAQLVEPVEPPAAAESTPPSEAAPPGARQADGTDLPVEKATPPADGIETSAPPADGSR